MDFYYDTGVSCDSCISNWFFFSNYLNFYFSKICDGPSYLDCSECDN